MPNSITESRRGDLMVLQVTTQHSTAEITPYGAHVLSFTPNGAEDILWVSEKAIFTEGKAIRGGIPICWPWFGSVKSPAHGLARISLWQVLGHREEPDGSETICFALDLKELGLSASAHVNVGKALTVELVSRNISAETKTLSMALHSYFSVGDSSQITVSGFENAKYLCKLENTEFTQQGSIVIDREVDRIYRARHRHSVIDDPVKGRKILVERFGSQNAVVWNPWIDKAARMSDFGDEEYKTMVCVEAANLEENQPILAPGASFSMVTRISLDD